MLDCYYFIKCVYLILISITYSLQSNETRIHELNILEKEKSDLLKQIHVAIDESVALLQKENTTQNMEGLKYMLELKQQIERPNDAENITLIEEDSQLEHRRKMINPKFTGLIERQLKISGLKTDKDFDVNSLFHKHISKDKLNELMQSRLAMQKRLDEWILQREIEKAKSRNRYLANKRLVQAGLLEKCPRFGYDTSKKEKFRRRYKSKTDSDEKPQKVRRNRRKKKYPCCRKCCKKSYMGCL